LYLALGWFENRHTYHHALPLLIISLLWINDTFAYLTGSLIGKHKMTPILSPGKTWEGFFGGMIITILAGWIGFRITNSYTLWIWIIISLTTVIFGFIGDISESKIKRIYKIKNSGNLLPGHGGILDRFDSLLFAAPAVFIVLFIINYLR
jgi:phosphatidate cytidylyltransferase